MNGVVNVGAIISTVACDRRDGIFDLVQQGSDLRGVIDGAVGQKSRDDPPAAEAPGHTPASW